MDEYEVVYRASDDIMDKISGLYLPMPYDLAVAKVADLGYRTFFNDNRYPITVVGEGYYSAKDALYDKTVSFEIRKV